MAEATLPTVTRETASKHGSQGLFTIAWRNLWRNRRRTWLTSGGIAFAVWLLVFAMSMQVGAFDSMIDNGARLMLGHIQLQHPRYQDDPRLEYTISVSERFLSELESRAGVQVVAPRVQNFALLSVGERSFGAQVMGVDPAKEAGWSTLAGKVTEGRYLEGPGEVVLGSVLARNLAAAVGDEVVLLGTAKEGGVAAAVVGVVGTFSTGIADLDRGIAQIDIGEFREGWALAEEEVHAVILLADSVSASERIAAELQEEDDGKQWLILDWRALMPEVEQTMELKYVSVQFFFALIAIIVSFSVVNTFMMTVFERTPEFGMLMAVGMRPSAIMLQLLIEAIWLALLGISLGVAFSAALLLPLSATGIPLPEASAQLLAQFNMPERIYPGFSLTSVWVASLIMLVGTQFAAIVPALRIRRMRPVEALRASE